VKQALLRPTQAIDAAMTEKYCDDSTDVSHNAIKGVSGGEVPVTLVGTDKIRLMDLQNDTRSCLFIYYSPAVHRRAHQTLDRLASVSVAFAPVDRVPPGALAACGRLRELDVRGTLLAEWAAVAQARGMARYRYHYAVDCWLLLFLSGLVCRSGWTRRSYAC
jgi:hypothetical protein